MQKSLYPSPSLHQVHESDCVSVNGLAIYSPLLLISFETVAESRSDAFVDQLHYISRRYYGHANKSNVVIREFD